MHSGIIEELPDDVHERFGLFVVEKVTGTLKDREHGSFQQGRERATLLDRDERVTDVTVPPEYKDCGDFSISFTRWNKLRR